MSDILFDVTVEATSPFFGRLLVTNLHFADGSHPVKVKKYLYIKFLSPANIGNGDFSGVTQPWVDITPVIHNKPIAGNYLVRAKLNFHNAYTFNGQEKFTFYVNGNLLNNPQQFTSSFVIAADQIAIAPDSCEASV